MGTSQVGFHPRRSGSIRAAVDPRNRNRLALSSPRGGFATIAGLLMLWLAAALELAMFRADEPVPYVLGGIVVGVIGTLLFSRRAVVLDRRRERIERGWQLVGTSVATSTSPLVGRSVVIDEKVETHQSDDHSWSETVFDLFLNGGTQELPLGRLREWGEMRQIGESVSAFLDLPLDDRVAGTTTSPAELDFPLVVRLRREAWKKTVERPDSGASVSIARSDDRSTLILMQSPRGEGVLGLAAILFVIWTIPATFMGNLPFALFPVVVALAIWVKVRFGLGSVVYAEPDRLTVENHGLFIIRIRKFATHEIEDLLVRTLEQGGIRGLYDMVADDVLVVRSDRMVARAGWGLSRDELHWIREEILDVISRGDPSAPASAPSPLDEIPLLGHGVRFPVVLGLLLGIVMTNYMQGTWTICLAAPFLEHILSVTSLTGLAAGFLFSRLRGDARPHDRVFAIAILAGLAFFLSFAGRHPLVQPYPTFDENVVAALPKIPRIVWIGWIPVATVGNALIAAVVGSLFAAPLRWVRSRRPEGQAQPAAKVARERAAKAPRRPLRSYLPERWANADYGTLFGGALAGCLGIGIILVSIFGARDDGDAPPLIGAAAGAAFFFAGTAILSQALPLRGPTRELVGRLAAALLLASFGAVAVWATLSASLIFAPGAIILIAMAVASLRNLRALFRTDR